MIYPYGPVTITVADGGTTASHSIDSIRGSRIRTIEITAPNISSATYAVSIVNGASAVVFTKALLVSNVGSSVNPAGETGANLYPNGIPLNNRTGDVHTIAITTSGSVSGAKAFLVTLNIEE